MNIIYEGETPDLSELSLSDADFSNGIIYLEMTYGCNMDPEVTYYGQYNCGCTNSQAYNYLPEANWDDGSCIYMGDLNYDGVIDVSDVVSMIDTIL